MKLTILAFGFTKDILGKRFTEIIVPDGITVEELRSVLFKQYPALVGMASFKLAVNSEYAESTQTLHPEDEVALIPPVSGG
jgi:molybdopterin synthase sulfur carrier subunit